MRVEQTWWVHETPTWEDPREGKPAATQMAMKKEAHISGGLMLPGPSPV